MLWGCISINGVRNLEFIPSTMDNRTYVENLKKKTWYQMPKN